MGKTLQQLTGVTPPVVDTDILPLARGAGLLQSVSALALKNYVGGVALPVSVANGGTGATTAAGARTNLGLGTLAVLNSPVPVANGGTGAATGALAQVNLGFGEYLISSSTFTASAGPAFTLSGYNSYRLQIIGLIPSGTPTLTLQLSFDGGATYKAGASDYAYASQRWAGVSGFMNSAAATAMSLTGASIDATASKANEIEMTIAGPKAAGFGVSAKWLLGYFSGGTYITEIGTGQIVPGYGTPTNARIVPSAGTLSGGYALYGRIGF